MQLPHTLHTVQEQMIANNSSSRGSVNNKQISTMAVWLNYCICSTLDVVSTVLETEYVYR